MTTTAPEKMALVMYDVRSNAPAYAKTVLSRRLCAGPGIRINYSVFLIKSSYIQQIQQFTTGLANNYGRWYNVHTVLVDKDSVDTVIELARTSVISEVKRIKTKISDAANKVKHGSVKNVGDKSKKSRFKIVKHLEELEIRASLFGLTGDIDAMVKDCRKALGMANV